MFDFELKNQSGVALLEIVISMVILTVVMASLIVSISFARFKSLTNYHDRIVLLALDSELQTIKSQFINSIPANFNFPSKDIVIEDIGGKRLIANITVIKKLHYDPSISPQTRFWEIKVVGRWKEHPTALGNLKPYSQERVKVLREDYYFEDTQ